uniref:Golgin B1 n=1 Tax=Tetraodon nigroviridis TaxID=99883 RepID=H3C6A0_TETNG
TTVEEMSERLGQTEQLVAQLKELIREKDAALCSKDEQLKAEKEASEAKLSKLRLQNKAKVTSLTTQLEELRKQRGALDTPTHGKKRKEEESRQLRGEEMDAMLIERDRKLAEKEAYIVHLQTALSGEQSVTPAPPQEAEERYSLLQEQSESLTELLLTEKEQYTRRENIQTFKDILIQKDNQLMEVSQMHEQELFKLAAKSDASADLEQLLKALKQKLHEKEEVLLGRTQVINVLQGEVDGRDQQIKDLMERLHRLQVERESLESKMEAEKHVMRAQLRDMMEKQRAEIQRLSEQHRAQMEQTQQQLLGQLEEESSQLQQQLSKKEESLEKELKASKEERNRLHSQAEEYRKEAQTVSQQLEEQKRSQGITRGEMKATAETAAALEAQLREAEKERQRLEAELKTRDSEKEKHKEELNVRNETIKSLTEQMGLLRGAAGELESGAELRQKELIQLHSQIQALTEDKQQLQAARRTTEKELALQSQRLCDLQGQLKEALEQNSSLSAELGSLTQKNRALREDLAQKLESVSELAADRSALQQQLSGLEEQIAEDRQATDRLVKQKEELGSTVDELKKVLEESHQSNAAGLLEKTNKSLTAQLEVELECVRRERSEAALHLQQKEEELNKERQSGLSLSSQLSQVTQKNELLARELEQRKAEITDLSDNVQALSQQRATFKSELRETGTALARSQEEVAQLKAECSRQEGLQVALQEKEQLLRQKEALIQQMTASKAELDQLLRQKTDEAVSLSTQTSDLQESIRRLRGQLERSALEVSTLQRSLQQKEESSLEGLSRSAAALETLRTDLQDKQAECLSLKEQLSHLRESVTELSSALRAQSTEVDDLKRVLGQKDAALSDQGRCLQDVQSRADEASLFKAQFMESTELVSQLQSQLHSLSTECARLDKSAGEAQSAFNNLKEKYATSLEELQDARGQLSQRMEEVSSLQKQLEDSASQHQRAAGAVETLRSEISAVGRKLERALLSEMQTLQEVNQRLQEEMASAKEEHQKLLAASSQENARLKEDAGRFLAEKEELEDRCHRLERQSSSLGETMARTTSERDDLQTKVSVQDKELSQLKDNVRKVEQILQDSEREWLLVLEREKEEKNQLVERLTSVENEMSSKDEKLALASSAIRLWAPPSTAYTVFCRTELGKELAQVRLEKTKLERKVQAALLARKEAMKKAEEQERALTQELTGVSFEEKVRDLEELRSTCSSDQDELAALRQLLQERDESLRDLKLSLDQHQSASLANLKEELEDLKSQNGHLSEELASKEEALMVGEQRAQALDSKLLTVVEHLETAQAELRDKSEQVEKHQEALRAQELTAEQEKGALESQLDLLTSALEEERRRCAEQQSRLDLSEREQAGAATLIRQLKDELGAGGTKLAQFDKQREKLQEDLKERQEAFLMSRAQLSEKEELRPAVELQLQQQSRAHHAWMERAKSEAAELQRSQQHPQDGQSKMAALTRKLQAALLSRKELMKENSALKQDAKRLAEKEHAKEVELSALEAALEEVKREKRELETSASKDKVELRGEMDRLLSENHSLSAACGSLKLTIENMGQQKEAFSCQLEALKDSQAEELSRWRSQHAELKQQHESLLRSYQSTGAQMDAMRHVLEATERDALEAVRKSHRLETERDALEKQARELEGEHDRIKERMHTFSREKQWTVEELEREKQNSRRRLRELEENHSREASELGHANQQLEAEICRLRASAEELGEKLSELQSENKRMAQELQESSCTLEERSAESERSRSSLQLQLEEALGRMETQTTELGAQVELNNLLQKEKQNLSQHMEAMQTELGKKEALIQELQEVVSRHSQETVSLNEKVRILEDDKSLLQEELENVQETSDKVKNEKEYLETVLLQNSEKVDELTESVAVLQSQNLELNSQLAASSHTNHRVRQEKEEEQLRLVRELEEKLRAVQRGSQGSKTINKELQELLKEKHQEINQLQQNCIRYQEVILQLESSSKSSQAAVEQLQRELEKSSEQLSAVRQKCSRAEAELSEQRNLLQQAQQKRPGAESQRDPTALDLSHPSRSSEGHRESQPAEKADKEAVLQQQMAQLVLSKDQESKKVQELKQQLDSGDVELKALEGALRSSEAKLSALSARPAGPEASSLWTQVHQQAGSEDHQLLEPGSVIKRSLQNIRVKEKEMDELRLTHLKLQRTIDQYSVAAAAQQRQLFVLSANNADVCERAELMGAQVTELSAQVDRLEKEKDLLRRQLSDREDAVCQTQLQLQQAQKVNTESEAELLRLQAASERLEGLAAHLKTLLQSKDAEISSLLSCKDAQMSGYLQQLQANGRSQAAAYEARLAALGHQREAAAGQLRGLQAKVRHLQVQVDTSSQESQQAAAKMDAFRKSMAALQSERERLVSRCRTLETENRLGLRGPDGEGGASKGLKQEIRKLLNQMDDLNSENAMLRAQLVRYREDLNQVLSLKDDQLKLLLQKQQDAIRNLEQQKAAAEEQQREARLQVQQKEEESEALRAQLARERGGAAQLRRLQQELLSQRTLTAELRQHIQLLEEDQGRTSTLVEAARLAEDQPQLPQKLSESESQGRSARLQNEALRKAMAALQDDRDRLIEDFKTLRNGYDQELRESRAAFSRVERSLQEASSDLAVLAKQRDVLLLQLDAFSRSMGSLQNERDRLMEELSAAKR